MRKVEQVMSPRVITIDAGRSAHETLVMMSEPGVSCVVVTLNDRLAGIVTERDAVELLSEGENLKNVQISMVMSTPVLSVPVGTTVHKAAMIMKQEKIRRVVVVNSAGGIEGILTQSDIVKGLQGQYIDSLKEIIREKEDIFRQTARELLDKTVYLDNILTSAIDMVIIATDGDLRIKYYNPVAEKVFGYAAPQAVGRTTPELAELESIAPVKLQKARDIVKKEGKYHFRAKIAREGSYRYYDGVMSGIRDHQNRLIGYVLMLHDVTERKCHEDTIRHLAYHDALTGLPNRLLLSDRVTQVLSLASRNAGRGALMILDLDRFKDINDTLGHSTGDLLLKEVARRLLRLLRKSDTVSRMGGDEFVLLLPTTVSSESAAATASRIVKAFHKPFNCEGSVLHVTASIGIATYPDDGCDAETLLKKADIALYQAKEGGRNNYCRFLPT
jgi:diguanylate cyclase (GGDEF)-like protein/PAS domain S-box-containing protein